MKVGVVTFECLHEIPGEHRLILLPGAPGGGQDRAILTGTNGIY